MKNKYRLFKAVVCMFMSFVMMNLCITSYSAEVVSDVQTADTLQLGTLEANEYSLMHENENTRLYCALSGENLGTFAVENLKDGSVWYSTPLNASDDTTTLNIAAMKSLITFTYYDESSYAMVSMNSYADSVLMDGLGVQKLKNGLRFNFSFPNVKIMIPLTVVLNDDGSISAKVDVKAIKEKGKFKVFDVTVLPYFCVASQQENGFILAPDGSGAVMELNNGKTTYQMYNQPVYGGDAGEISLLQSSNTEKIYMPVFGLKRDDSGIFTVITQGAAQSSISAAVAGVESDYNAIWNTFAVRKVTTYSLDQGWQGTKSFSVYQETEPTIETIENRYWFLSGENSDLSGMALTYRNYLKKAGLSKAKNEDAEVFVDMLGAVTRTKSILGFPMETKMVATSFEDAKDIMKDLNDSDISKLSFRYLEWDSLSIKGKIVNKASVESKLGGKKEFLKLADYAQKNNIGFYPSVDLTHFSKTSYFFQQYFDATKNMNLEVNRYFPYKLNIFNKDTDRTSWFVLNYKKLNKTSSSFLKSYQKLGIDGIALGDVGTVVTSDYSKRKDIVEPWAGAEKYREIVSKYSQSNSLLLDAPIFPNVIYADKITNIPESSEFDMFDYEVPFYQMVISGSVSYTGKAVNLSDNPENAVLSALKTGSDLHYSLTENSKSDIVKDTLYNSWIGTSAKKWIPTIKEQYKEIQTAYEKIGSKKLVGFYKRQSGITVSCFDGGGEVWINENSFAVTDGDVTLKPNSYCIRKAGITIE